MHYPKPSEHATFKWTPPLPFYDFGQRKYVYQNLLNTLRNKTFLKTNESKGKTNGLNHVSAWLKLNPITVVPIWIINLSHLGGFLHYGTPSYFSHGCVLRNFLLISYKRRSYGVKSVWFDMLTINTTTLCGRHFLGGHWSHNIIFMHHFTDTINVIMKNWITLSWWSLEVGTPTLAERPFLDLIISCNISCK